MGERGEGFLWQPVYTDRHKRRRMSSIWWWRISIDGRKHPMSTGKTTRKEARAWAIAKLAEMRGGDVSVLTADRLTLDRLQKLVADDYVVNARKTKRHIPLSFGRLKRVLGDKVKARDITTARLKAYVAQRLEEGSARATINLDLALLQKGLNLAAREGLIPPRPKGWLPVLQLNNARQGFLERPAFHAVLAHVPKVLHGCLTAAYITGWRLASDLLTREWRHVDLKAGWLRLEPGEGKTREGRMFPLTPELRAVMEAQRAYTDEVQRELGKIVPWVFHRAGRPIVSLQKSWEAARVKAGLPTALIHDFRRTAVRNLERAGVSRSAAMALVGHKTEAIYRRYAIVDEAVLQEGAAKLAALHETQRAEAAKVEAMPPSGGQAAEPIRPGSSSRAGTRGPSGGA